MVKKGAGRARYEPGPAFEESKEEAILDISPTDSMEFWLIQWPINQLDVSDFHGEEVSLKLHHDGNLGSLESSSGKSYELVSFAAQQPDATVFLPSGSETKAVGKISRRVCLVRYPEPEEFEKPGFGSLTPSSKKSTGSSRKTMSRFTSASKNRSSQGSALSLGQRSAEPTPKYKQKRKDESSLGHSNVSGKSSEGSQARGADSNMTSDVPQTPAEKSKKEGSDRRVAVGSCSSSIISQSSSPCRREMLIFPELSAAPAGAFAGKTRYYFPCSFPGSSFCWCAECFDRPLGGICEMRLESSAPCILLPGIPLYVSL